MTGLLVARRARVLGVTIICVGLAAAALVLRSGTAGAQDDAPDAGTTSFVTATDFATDTSPPSPPAPTPRTTGGRGGIAINMPIGFPPGLTFVGADLHLAITDPSCGPGCEEFSYTVSNSGPEAAAGVVLSGSVSPVDTTAFVLISSASSTQGTCTHAEEGNSFRCELGTLAPGTTVTVTVDAEVCAPSGSSRLVASGTVESSTPDPDPANNATSATTPNPVESGCV